MSWVERVETVMSALKGSSIEEIELTEGELKILIRRSPGNIIAVRTLQQMDVQLGNIPAPRSTKHTLDMRSPLTGVYYSAASPTSAPFINVGDTVTVGQTIALIEAMKMFSEIPSEVSGRVVAIKFQSSDVVKKGDTLFQVEPA
jgi:acetyl-CoA carboxylase biotin carboxyl carrier protein